MADATLDALLSANLSGPAQAVLTPDIKSAMSKGLSVVGDLTPSYNLIDTLANGGTPSLMNGVEAMAGLATIVNPVAGAAVMVAGTLINGIQQGLNDLLTSLGLINPAPKPLPYIGLIKVGKPIPKDSTDPLWWGWDDFAKVYFTGSATDFWVVRPDSRLAPGEIRTGETSSQDRLAMALIFAIIANDYTVHDSPGHLAVKGTGIANALPYQPRPRNEFEAFFFEVLKRDLEYWANGQPWIDPRALLHAAVTAWNTKHQPAVKPGDMTFTYQPSETSSDIIPLLLSSRGDGNGTGRRDSIDTVYGGQVLMSPPPTGPNATLHAVHVPATPAAPAQTLFIATPRALPASAQNLAFSAVFQKYKKLGMSDDNAIAAAEKEMTGAPSKAISSVTVAKPLPMGMSMWKKVGIAVLALGGGAVLLLGRGRAS